MRHVQAPTTDSNTPPTPVLSFRGRKITVDDIAFLRQLIAESPGCSRRKLSELVCDAWTGRGNNAPTMVQTKSIKEVLGYPLVKDFREQLGRLS